MKKLLPKILLYLLGTVLLAAVAYGVFALCFNTDVEKRLRRENRMYARILPGLSPREDLLVDALASLQHKDNDIYERVFNSAAPETDPVSGLDFLFASDTIPEKRLARYASDKADRLVESAAAVDALFEQVLATMADSSFRMPPMSLPLKDLTYPQVGASTGSRVNPFLKASINHNGLDIIAERGTPVYATADGMVCALYVNKSEGRVLEIRHECGFRTRFCHLDATTVTGGQRVRRGQRIGSVGMSGKSTAPHLHYEVLRDSIPGNPVNHFFASVGPEEYANMLYMTVNTMQSMD